MSKNNIVVEGAEVAPFDVETVNVNTDIVPVNTYSQDDITEVTPGQAAGVMLATGLVGWGVGKLLEFAYKKAIKPGIQKFVDNWNEKHSKNEKDEKVEEPVKSNKKSKKSKKNEVDPNQVEIEIHDPSSDEESDKDEEYEEYEEDVENDAKLEKYQKKTQEIMSSNKKKNKRRK